MRHRQLLATTSLVIAVALLGLALLPSAPVTPLLLGASALGLLGIAVRNAPRPGGRFDDDPARLIDLTRTPALSTDEPTRT